MMMQMKKRATGGPRKRESNVHRPFTVADIDATMEEMYTVRHS